MKNRVKMLSTLKGVHDGHLHPVLFEEGEEYEIGPDLLQAFVNAGAIEMVAEGSGAEPEESDVVTSDAEMKSEGDAPANKMKKAAPENKKK